MKKAFWALVILVSGSFAHAGTVYDNTSLAPDDSYYGIPLAGYTTFNSFSTGGDSGLLSGLELVLTDENNTDGGSVSVYLYENSTSCSGLGASSCPGSLVANIGTVLDSAMGLETLINVSLTDNPSLAANTRYWIALGTGSGGAEWADSFASYGTTGTGVDGEFQAGGDFPYTTTAGVTANSTSTYTPLMQVTLGSDVSAPEPGSLFLCAGGLGVMLIALRRRRQVR